MSRKNRNTTTADQVQTPKQLSVEEIFQHSPEVAKVYESEDGVLHTSQAGARMWQRQHGKKVVNIHENPNPQAATAAGGDENNIENQQS